MILEQAFFHLPEILTGSGYPRQRYEGGIVSAYCLALLQTLNGRNVANPISCLQAERPFRGTKAWDRGDSGGSRYLRSDLHVRLDRLEVGSERLSAYGFRSSNWLEAKFFRKSTSNKQQNTGHLLEDLIRLLTLVPPRITNVGNRKRDTSGRYLLHVYESFHPDDYLSVNRQLGGASEARKWLAPLISGGPGKCDRIKLTSYETDGILKQINEKLGALEIEFEATTWRLGPTFDLGAGVRQYVCLLTRIDSFKISRNKASISVQADRTYLARGGFQKEIREYVGKWISIKPELEGEKPDAAEASEFDTDP